MQSMVEGAESKLAFRSLENSVRRSPPPPPSAVPLPRYAGED